jgi:nitrogen regulatory protein PII
VTRSENDGERKRAPAAPGDGEGYYHLTVIVKPFRLDAVLSALKPFHVVSLTAAEVRGYGRQKGHLELYRGSEYVISFIPKVKLELVAPAGEIEEITRAIQMAARTGRIGDGKIFLHRLEGLESDEPLP